MSHNLAVIYQAIRTRFIGPTDTRGSRVKAIAEAGSVTLPWNHAFNADRNHFGRGRSLGWKGDLDGGCLHGNGDHVWVQIPDGTLDAAQSVLNRHGYVAMQQRPDGAVEG